MAMPDNEQFNILIVDDISRNIQVLGNVLREEGYMLSFATSGKQALDMVVTDRFDLILLDVMMPEMDGFEVCTMLKQIPEVRDIPVIFLTAKTDIDSVIKGFDVGAVDYVTKPFNARELLARVRTHLALKHAHEELRRKNEEIRLLSITDPLTGCYNRGYITDRLAGEIKLALRYRRPLSLILCDIDYFKQVNDTYGHQAGDHVLKEFVCHIQMGIRDNVDWLARYGGEEFLMVLPETEPEGAMHMAERLRATIASRIFCFEAKEIRITSSFGVTGFGIEASAEVVTVDNMIKYADRFLYKAKQRGRNRVEGGTLEKAITEEPFSKIGSP